MERTGSAVWNGELQHGSGHLTTASGALQEVPYSAKSRFGTARGTNPEELIGAAHAGCFSMALAKLLEKRGFSAEKIDTTATVVLKEADGRFAIRRIQLRTRAAVPGVTDEIFQSVAEEARASCPVSQALSPEIELEAALVH